MKHKNNIRAMSINDEKSIIKSIHNLINVLLYNRKLPEYLYKETIKKEKHNKTIQSFIKNKLWIVDFIISIASIIVAIIALSR